MAEERPDKLAEGAPRALDLFCGAGGASMGLHRAGFDVTGIDIRPQPHYPFRFIQGDAIEPPVDLADFDFIWASPVCKRYTDGATARMAKGAVYPDQIAAVRELLRPHPMTCIENVMRAPLRADLVLHGHMFGLRVIRRRQFELSWHFFLLVPPLPKGLLREGFVCMVGNGTPTGIREMGLPHYTAALCRAASGIDWMNRGELSQAIPPAYSEFIGRAALAHLHRTASIRAHFPAAGALAGRPVAAARDGVDRQSQGAARALNHAEDSGVEESTWIGPKGATA